MKKIMTLEQHRAVGASLTGMRNRLTEDLVTISNAMGKTRARPQTDRLRKAIALIDAVRCDMEDEMLRDGHFKLGRGNSDGALDVYYGPRGAD